MPAVLAKVTELVKSSINPNTSLGAMSKPTQQSRIQEISTYLDQLMKKHRVGASAFSRIATWFNARSLWLKIGFGLISMAAGALIGIAFMPLLITAPIFSAVVGLLIYLLPCFALIHHHRAETKHKDALLAEIAKMEHILHDSITAFQATEVPMKQVLASLEQKNTEKETDIKHFKAAVTSLQHHLSDADASLSALKDNQATLVSSNQMFGQTIRQTTTAHTGLNQQQCDLTRVNQALAGTQSLLQQDAQTFHVLTEDVDRSKLSLQALERKFEALENSEKSNHRLLEEHISRLNHLTQSVPRYTDENPGESSAEIQERALAAVRRVVAMYNPSENTRDRLFTTLRTTSESSEKDLAQPLGLQSVQYIEGQSILAPAPTQSMLEQRTR